MCRTSQTTNGCIWGRNGLRLGDHGVVRKSVKHAAVPITADAFEGFGFRGFFFNYYLVPTLNKNGFLPIWNPHPTLPISLLVNSWQVLGAVCFKCSIVQDKRKLLLWYLRTICHPWKRLKTFHGMRQYFNYSRETVSKTSRFKPKPGILQRAGGVGDSYSWIAELVKLCLYMQLRQPSLYKYNICRDVSVDLVKTIQNKEMCEHLYI